MELFDPTPCTLGEGLLWHPTRQSLFWFDIIGKTLFERKIDAPAAQSWQFDEHISAAAWLDEESIIIASETQIFTFDLQTKKRETLTPLEKDQPLTRSNDGRADPQGGFWIGTMGKNAEARAGAIYRFFRGELRKLYGEITIPNAISFAPSGQTAYFCDTLSGQIMRVALDGQGWPNSSPEIFLDLRAEGLNPDGAVVDAQGNFWNAQWGAARIAGYTPQGQFLQAFKTPTPHASCPSFGGKNLQTLFATTARQGLAETSLEGAGQTYFQDTEFRGQKEHQFIL